ncbi:MAG TPA: hypothetical protein VHB50_18400, partial [Bryobacteraceae bacterium]|nr:hypothetical protein [Bryobacteraceae bacterium]
DGGIEYGKTYQYMTQSIEKAGDRYAESDLSDPVTFQPTDRFAPAAPAGVTVVPGTQSIELVWDRSPEKDLAFYRVYRDGQRIADHVTAPALSDKDVKSGATHRYQVSAVDAAGNESPMSAPVEANLP